MKGTFNFGHEIINCTPHPIRFLNHDGQVVEVPPSGYTLAATPQETAAGSGNGYALVRTVFIPSEKGNAELEEIESAEMLPVGSIFSAQAWPGRVVGLVPVEGYERKPPAENLYRCDKFNTF